MHVSFGYICWYSYNIYQLCYFKIGNIIQLFQLQLELILVVSTDRLFERLSSERLGKTLNLIQFESATEQVVGQSDTDMLRKWKKKLGIGPPILLPLKSTQPRLEWPTMDISLICPLNWLLYRSTIWIEGRAKGWWGMVPFNEFWLKSKRERFLRPWKCKWESEPLDYYH